LGVSSAHATSSSAPRAEPQAPRSSFPDQTLLDEVGSFFLAVFRAFASDVARQSGVRATPGQIRVLQVVSLNPGASVVEIARGLAVSNASACTALGKLARLGWVKQEVDRSDRRVRRVCLTRKGQSVVGEFQAAQAHRVAAVLARFNKKEINEFRGSVRRITKAIGDIYG
jgi:DNA-binding MarR family transcriptional regulator